MKTPRYFHNSAYCKVIALHYIRVIYNLEWPNVQDCQTTIQFVRKKETKMFFSGNNFYKTPAIMMKFGT